ncbi:cytochrome c maturation protein CcmE [Candidatus Methylomirabilis limnetica]|uniref:cytochrome c maturation protein CcmE n=1 Tax=Candidatus Methylomirabilis limnetica TaxID=2033718 RepID=UPI00137B4198|nr:cytochrome c maturation protein CcmE [Candidatus Methylomirabilis limnetica]
MKKKTKLLLGAVVIASTIGYLIVGGIREAAVYYITPTELKQKGSATTDRAFRVGGMVVAGSRSWDPQTLKLTFRLGDEKEQVAVEYVGSPPDLFKEGSGAIVEGKYMNGLFQADTILAKHSEEYRPPEEGQATAKDHYRTLVKPPATRP